jgi:acyl carrier protein
MTINTKEELIQFIFDKNIRIEYYVEKKGIEWNYNAKSFSELVEDDIDIIEIIMDIEKDYDCEITDKLCDDLGILNANSTINPNELCINFIRDQKLKDLGIN